MSLLDFEIETRTKALELPRQANATSKMKQEEKKILNRRKILDLTAQNTQELSRNLTFLLNS